VSQGSGTDDDPDVAGRGEAPDAPQLVMRQKTYRYRQDLDWQDTSMPVSLQGPIGAALPDAPAPDATAPDTPAGPAVVAPDTPASPPAPVPALTRELVASASPSPTKPQRGVVVTSSAPIGTSARPHQVVDRDRELERQEHLATAGRMRRLMPLATVLWLGFFFVDFVLATWVVPGPLLPYLYLRLVGVVPILVSWWWLVHGPTPSPRTLALLDLAMTTSSATILALMCLLSGGLTSPYATYIAMVIAGRAASTPDHWRTGVVRLGVPALASPVVLALALPFSDALREQLHDPGARGTYFFHLMLIGGAWVSRRSRCISARRDWPLDGATPRRTSSSPLQSTSWVPLW
jgi:hypothetical protein